MLGCESEQRKSVSLEPELRELWERKGYGSASCVFTFQFFFLSFFFLLSVLLMPCPHSLVIYIFHSENKMQIKQFASSHIRYQ